MLTSHSMGFRALISISTSLRAAGKPREAMALIEQRLPGLEVSCLATAYRELVYAGLECGDRSKAAAFARKLHEFDPGNQLARAFLGEGSGPGNGA